MVDAPYVLDGGVAVVRLDAPPVNALGSAMRRRLMAALEAAAEDARVRVLVLIGNDEVFSAGADLNEFDTPDSSREASLPALIDAIESGAKPVVAALGRTCMGGGLELALACHHRIAIQGAKVALPEVKLGLLPGAGGTQRLPRALGLPAALNLMLTGEAAPVETFTGTPFIDAVVGSNLLAEAVDFARRVVEERWPLRRLRDLNITADSQGEYLRFVRNQLQGPSVQAQLSCIEAVGAALGDFEAGLAKEQSLFWSLMATPASRALRHAFLAERNCAKVRDLPGDTPVRPLQCAGVVGAGTMGSGIAICLLDAGMPVTLVERNDDALARGRDLIEQHYAAQISKGRLGPADAKARVGRLRCTTDMPALAQCDLVIEAVFEDMAVKEAVLRQIDQAARPGAILASNTSTLNLDRLAVCTSRPGDLIGLHFFSPAPVMKLLEIVRGAQTTPDVLATALLLARRLRKTAVVAGVCDGFIGNRMVNEYLRIAGLLVDAGALPWQIDTALERWGMAMGPFRMTDMAGNDIGQAICKRLAVERPALRFSALGDRLCEAGRLGQKAGRGWYAYPAGARRGEPDPEVDRLIVEHRCALGVSPRRFADAEIVERCIYALVNEGARVLEEGIAQRASDIDVVYLTGYGFPRWRGGPMHYAQEVGLHRVLRRMRDFAREDRGDADFWTPAGLLVRAAGSGEPIGVAA